jgi:hypothetical protein
MSRLSKEDIERDPIAFVAWLKQDLSASLLSTILETCDDNNWVTLRDAGIFSVFKKIIEVPILTDVVL